MNIGDTPERSASSQSNVNPSAPIRDYLDALVHPSVRADVLMAVRHRAFMAPRLFGSALENLKLSAATGAPCVALATHVLAWQLISASSSTRPVQTNWSLRPGECAPSKKRFDASQYKAIE